MLEDLDHLRNDRHLMQLLSHYASLGAEDREIWQGRLMFMQGVKPPQLVKLHGQLIAFTWVEQNTGEITVLLPGYIGWSSSDEAGKG